MPKAILISLSIFLFLVAFFQTLIQTQTQIFLKKAPTFIESLQKEIKDLEILLAQETSPQNWASQFQESQFVELTQVKYIRIPAPGVAISK